MKMTRRKFVGLAVLVGGSLALGACKSEKDALLEAAEQYRDDYALAVIRTTQHRRSSYIEYYDENLNLIRSVWYPYAQLDFGWHSPSREFENELYLIPRGIQYSENDKKLISLNLCSGVVREYFVDQTALKGLAVCKSSCYAINSIIGSEHISKVNTVSGEVSYLRMKDTIPGTLVGLGENLGYIYESLNGTNERTHLTVFDSKMEVIGDYDITNQTGSTSCTSPTLPKDNQFYFIANIPRVIDEGIYTSHIYNIDSSTGVAELFCTSEEEFGFIVQEGASLFAFGSLVPRSGLVLFFRQYDCITKEMISEVLIDYNVVDAFIKDQALIVLGDEEMIRYRVDGASVVEELRVSLYSSYEQQGHWPSGLFKR